MALSFDPEQLPVIAVDAHLPPIDPRRLQPDALRRRFAEPLRQWAPEIAVERRLSAARAPAAAAVLVGLVRRADGLAVLFTQRTAHLTDHPGQISFPGGRAEAFDADPTATALREAREEIGLEARHVEVLGSLPEYTTGTGFVVTPVIALVDAGLSVQADPFEVAEVFEVPLAYLMSPSNHRWHRVDAGGEPREFLSMPWTGRASDGTERRYFVWGATAAMLRNLYRFLAA